MNTHRRPSALRNIHNQIVKITQSFENKQRRWWSPRGFLLFVLPLPLLPALVISLAKGDFSKSLVHVAAIALFLTGALLARRGLLLESHDEDTRIRKNPPPLKTLAACLLAIATGLCAWLAVGHTPIFSIMLSLLSVLAFYLSYGLDPLAVNKSFPSNSGFDQTAFLALLNEAQEKIDKIQAVSARVTNIELKSRLLRITGLARDVIKSIEQDPRDLHRARKFLYVYLDGAQRVSEGYARTHERANSTELEDKFRNVLVTIEDVFTQQQKRLLENDILDLDVQIEVLNQQMKNEGIR